MAYIGKTPTPVPLTSSDIASDIINSTHIGDTAISGFDALATAPADTDEFLISDAGVLKRLDASLVGGGKLLQVITATDSTKRTTSSTSYVTASNTLSIDITPSSTSSKIFLIGSISVYQTNGDAAPHLTIYRDSTELSGGTSLGGFRAGDGNQNMMFSPITHLDSPSSTSQITYQIYIKTGNGSTISFNEDSDTSTFTAFEIGG
jgi:hypothetical protein